MFVVMTKQPATLTLLDDCEKAGFVFRKGMIDVIDMNYCTALPKGKIFEREFMIVSNGCLFYYAHQHVSMVDLLCDMIIRIQVLSASWHCMDARYRMVSLVCIVMMMMITYRIIDGA